MRRRRWSSQSTNGIVDNESAWYCSGGMMNRHVYLQRPGTRSNGPPCVTNCVAHPPPLTITDTGQLLYIACVPFGISDARSLGRVVGASLANLRHKRGLGRDYGSLHQRHALICSWTGCVPGTSQFTVNVRSVPIAWALFCTGTAKHSVASGPSPLMLFAGARDLIGDVSRTRYSSAEYAERPKTRASSMSRCCCSPMVNTQSASALNLETLFPHGAMWQQAGIVFCHNPFRNNRITRWFIARDGPSGPSGSSTPLTVPLLPSPCRAAPWTPMLPPILESPSIIQRGAPKKLKFTCLPLLCSFASGS
ncbi:hypothetical protein ANO11243_079110 [Dothideomycetidae sp. 11243]|nr:hypothetical protein ANO11243_079110 [fungal sp. No.11243]